MDVPHQRLSPQQAGLTGFTKSPMQGKWLPLDFVADKNAEALLASAFFVSLVLESKDYSEYSARNWRILSGETPKPFTI